MTSNRPLRRTSLQFSQMRFTLARTFMANPLRRFRCPLKAEEAIFLAIGAISSKGEIRAGRGDTRENGRLRVSGRMGGGSFPDELTLNNGGRLAPRGLFVRLRRKR